MRGRTVSDEEIEAIDESPESRKWDKRTRAKGKRHQNETEGFVCAVCKCGFSEGEPYGMQAMCGSFGGMLTYWHGWKNHCIKALLARVQELEKILANHARLTWEQVRDMRRRYAAGGVTQRQLANEYGVCEVHVSMIIANKRWQIEHDPNPDPSPTGGPR
jgi:hypothetical protein